MPDILHLLRIKASRELVYRALTTPEGIRNWWTRDADLDAHIGGSGTFRFPFYGGGYSTEVRLIELAAPERVAWEVIASFRPEWANTTITFHLRPDGDSSTLLHFAHRGWADDDDTYALCNTGWAYYLVSLQQYIQIGEGAPSPDIDFQRMITATVT